MPHRRTPLALVLALAVALSGCGRTQRLEPGSPVLARQVVVRVANRGSRTVEVHLVADSGARARLGTVQPLQTENFRAPSGVLHLPPYRLQVQAVTSGAAAAAFATPALVVEPGQTLDLTLEESLRSSTWRVR